MTQEAVLHSLSRERAVPGPVVAGGHSPLMCRLVPRHRRFDQKSAASITKIGPRKMSRTDSILQRHTLQDELRTIIERETFLVNQAPIAAGDAIASAARRLVENGLWRLVLGINVRECAAMGRFKVGIVLFRMTFPASLAPHVLRRRPPFGDIVRLWHGLIDVGKGASSVLDSGRAPHPRKPPDPRRNAQQHQNGRKFLQWRTGLSRESCCVGKLWVHRSVAMSLKSDRPARISRPDFRGCPAKHSLHPAPRGPVRGRVELQVPPGTTPAPAPACRVCQPGCRFDNERRRHWVL